METASEVLAKNCLGSSCSNLLVHVLSSWVFKDLRLEKVTESLVSLNFLSSLELLHYSQYCSHDVLSLFRALSITNELQVLLELLFERLNKVVHILDNYSR